MKEFKGIDNEKAERCMNFLQDKSMEFMKQNGGMNSGEIFACAVNFLLSTVDAIMKANPGKAQEILRDCTLNTVHGLSGISEQMEGKKSKDTVN